MRRLVVLAPLLLFLALATAGRCYPPETRVVVFVQGLYTTLDDGRTQSSFVEGARFTALKDAFAARGYEDGDLLDYGYAGGEVSRAGAWSPADYECELTDRAADESLAVLETMLRDYRERHERVHFTLVGHSLGGYLAYLEGVREADRADGDKLDIDVVVTFDAPLLGVDADKKAIIDQIPCDKTYIAGAQIVADKLDAGLGAKRADETARMSAAGIRLANFGNVNDCLWNTGFCLPGATWVDDSGTQFLDGAAARFSYAIEANPLESHDAILAHGPAVAAAVEFVGAP
jgi:pimeloyl-ACP methyl ester carboxylesterase